MGLHLCPIEPDDWANGPNEPEGEECATCAGTGSVIVDKPGFHDWEETCHACAGSGYVEPPDPEPEMSIFD